MTIKELFKNLSRYDENTRLDFMYINHVESDSQFDIPLKLVGVIGSGDTVENCEVKYLELGLIEEK
jgi:hypothetical protein|tara:strand:- start:79 stop:276 length:198 start_codon:yes stop_codon:yes gene_type:complete